MTAVRLILEVTATGSFIARGIDEPLRITADDLAELREKLAQHFVARGCRPVLVTVRASEGGEWRQTRAQA